MPSSLQERILRALFLALRPICRSLLRVGIGYREFSAIAKVAFVYEATSGFGIRGRQTNLSRVAVMTGISRKEAARIRDRDFEYLSDASAVISPGAIVLQHWFTDGAYIESNGQPKVLSFDDGPVSFSSLVKAYGGDVPPGAMRSELKRIGAINELDDKRLVPIKRDFVPSGLDDRLALGFDSIIQSAAATLDHNCDPLNSGNLWVQQVWGVDTIDPKLFGEIQKEARVRLTEFGHSFDNYLASLEQETQNTHCNDERREVGVGLYYYEIPGSRSSGSTAD